MKLRVWLGGLLILLCLSGCYRSAVKGVVTDLNGDALPGVAVSVEGTSYQDLSNATGEYRVRYRPGTVRLHFAKTGYTPAVLDVDVGGIWRVDVPKVVMWHLPQNRGVYFFENGRYVSTDPVEPAAYSGGVFGTEKWPEAVTTNSQPKLIAHRLPVKGASLVQMKFVEAVPEGTESQEAADVWAAGAIVPTEAVPIDEPEHLLVEIRFKEPLPPGTYAVQWGALEGQREPVPSVYLFSVEPEPTAAEKAAAAPPDKKPAEKKPEDKKPKGDSASDEKPKPAEAKPEKQDGAA